MNEPTIICPTCETEILLTETLARPYIEAERAKLDQRFVSARPRSRSARLTSARRVLC